MYVEGLDVGLEESCGRSMIRTETGTEPHV